MKLYEHQEKFKESNPNKALLVWEGGTGKTVGACEWLKLGRDSNALVICPKRVVKKWEEELKKWGTKATVVSKEQFKKLDTYPWSAIVVDEADEFASPLFNKSRSQLSTALYEQVLHYPNIPIILLTATPIRSNPYNLHTLLCYMGHYVDWKKWRDRFFIYQKRPFLRHPAWFPRPNWQKDIREVLERHADIVLLKDCIKDLPTVTEEFIETKPKGKFVKDIDWLEPSKIFVEEHKFEQNDKIKYIKELGKEYRKVLVVAHYTDNVNELEKELSTDRLTFAVQGSTKDQEAILLEANEVDECYLIVQASLGAGFDADSFSVMVFTSMSYKVRDYVQMKYRIRRIHNLHPVKYVYMLGGRCDKAVYNTIKRGKDFVPSEYYE